MLKRVVILGALALFLGMAMRFAAVPSPAIADATPQTVDPSSQTPNGRPRWEPVWTRPTPDLVSMALSPDGSNVAWVDNKGSVRRIQVAGGRTVWQTDPLSGINRVCVGPQGAVVAYSRMNPASASLRVLDPAVGEKKSALVPVDGAVWTAQLSQDGQKVVVGTGRASLYVIPVRRDAVVNGPSVRLPGIPESVEVMGNDMALLGTWQEGGVCAWGLDRSPRWRREERVLDRTYDVHLSGGGTTAIAVSSEGPRHESARLHAWDARTGQLLFIEDLNGSSPKATVSANGRYIAVTYAQASEPGSNTTERKVALFDRTGRRLFDDRGGIYFSPELVCLSASGDRLTVRDPSGMLWTLDKNGSTVARLRLPIDAKTGTQLAVKKIVATDDGAYMLVQQGEGRSDGRLTLLKAVQ